MGGFDRLSRVVAVAVVSAIVVVVVMFLFQYAWVVVIALLPHYSLVVSAYLR